LKRHVREIEVEKGGAAVTLSLLGASAFTVGVEVDDGATVLELDLSRVRGVPKGFVDG